MGDWNAWNEQGGPKYPHEKVIQFCFRRYPAERRKGVRALDLGCGSGVHTVFMASEGFDVTGVDGSNVGIANTQRKLDALNLKAALRVEGIDVLDFPSACFDLVVCIGVLDAAGPTVARRSIERLTDVLSDGGRGLFLFASDCDFRLNVELPFNLSLHGYTRNEVEKLFADTFGQVWIDQSITTYEGGLSQQNDWLVTVQK